MIKDVEKLRKDYKPLILATFGKFNTLLPNAESKKELYQAIQEIFSNLVYEYDDRRRVDFPFYIKRMLELRTYHYVSKQINFQKNEFPSELSGRSNSANTKYEEIMKIKQSHSSQDNDESREDLENILKAMSWDDNFKMGKKQKRLFVGILRDHKSLEQLAKEEGCKISTLHTRLHFLIKKLMDETAKQQKKDQEENVGKTEAD